MDTSAFLRQAFAPYITYRHPLTHTHEKITKDKKVKVAYFGGSVTAGFGSTNGSLYSWRARSEQWFAAQFPDVQWDFLFSAIGANGTFLGTYRVQRDVIALEPDLLFIEYAINDKYGAFSKERAAWQCETIVREVRQALPHTDIVILLVIDEATSKLLPDLYPTAAGHAEIAAAYDISVVNVGRSLVESMQDPNDPDEWHRYYIDIVHPTDAGYAKYFECLEEYLDNALHHTDFSSLTDEAKPLPALQSDHLMDGDRKIVPAAEMTPYIVADGTHGYVFDADTRFLNLPKTPYIGSYTAAAEQTDAQITLRFTGTDLSLFTNFYSDSTVLYAVDGGEFAELRCDRNGPTRLLEDAAGGEHTVVIRPLSYGDSTKGVMQIGALLMRDATKQTTR